MWRPERARPEPCSSAGGNDLISRAELAILIAVLIVVAFLFWSRNVVVRVPGVPTPISLLVSEEQPDAARGVRSALPG